MIDRLEAVIRDAMQAENVVGLGIALVAGGQIEDARGFGRMAADAGQEVSEDTTFGAASITKPVIATGLLHYIHTGELDLDAPIDNVSFENPFNVAVTARHLLTHTAGLPVGNLPADPAARTLADAAAAGARVVAQPGTQIVYANWGWDVLAHLLGVLAKRPWHEEVMERVLAPMELVDSSFGTVPEATGHFVSRVDAQVRGLVQQPSSWDAPSGAGSLVSSARDLGRFVCAQVRQRDAYGALHVLHARSGSAPRGQGLGFRVDRFDGHTMIAHGGDGLGTTNLIAAVPERGVGVALLMNTGGAQAARTRIVTEALRLLLGSSARKSVPVDTSQYEGAYRSNFWDIELDLVRERRGLRVYARRGLTLAHVPCISDLEPVAPDTLLGRGGMFHGLELTIEPGPPARLHGGVYPWTFTRIGPVEPPPLPDEEARLEGAWTGTCESPIGAFPLRLVIEAPERVRASFLSVQEEPLSDVHVAGGRVEGEFPLELAPFGKLTIFVRLEALEPGLRGILYARGAFGEIEIGTELLRA